MSVGSLRWPLLALLGLLVAVAIALLATRAVSEDIGISSEPPSAARSLSPPAATAGAAKQGPGDTGRTETTTATTTAPPQADHEGGDGDDD